MQYVTQLAAAECGMTVAVLDPEISTAEDVAFVLRDSKANGLVYDPRVHGQDRAQLVQDLLPELATCTMDYGSSSNAISDGTEH